VVAATLRGLSNDVYFKVGLITIIGLAAKDAILIIEFAKDLRAQGKPLHRGDDRGVPAALPPDPDDRARLRCGVLPMVIATAPARAASRRSAPA
jgi:multidrug efflux pump